MQNFSVRLEGDDGGYCTLDSSILAQNETSESIGIQLLFGLLIAAKTSLISGERSLLKCIQPNHNLQL
jgi:hypothetical protein